MTAGLVHIYVTSGTARGLDDDGVETFRPFCTVEAKAEDGSLMVGQLDVGEVRNMAMQFLEVAEAAEQDSLIFRVMTRPTGMGAPPGAVAQLVKDLRKERTFG